MVHGRTRTRPSSSAQVQVFDRCRRSSPAASCPTWNQDIDYPRTHAASFDRSLQEPLGTTTAEAGQKSKHKQEQHLSFRNKNRNYTSLCRNRPAQNASLAQPTTVFGALRDHAVVCYSSHEELPGVQSEAKRSLKHSVSLDARLVLSRSPPNLLQTTLKMPLTRLTTCRQPETLTPSGHETTGGTSTTSERAIFTPLVFLICAILLLWEFSLNDWEAESQTENPSPGPSAVTIYSRCRGEADGSDRR